MSAALRLLLSCCKSITFWGKRYAQHLKGAGDRTCPFGRRRAATSATPREAGGTTITTNVDEIVNNDTCSLREAVQAARTNAAVFDDCPAGSAVAEDRINLANDTTYLLSPGAGDDLGDLDSGDRVLALRVSEQINEAIPTKPFSVE